MRYTRPTSCKTEYWGVEGVEKFRMGSDSDYKRSTCSARSTRGFLVKRLSATVIQHAADLDTFAILNIGSESELAGRLSEKVTKTYSALVSAVVVRGKTLCGDRVGGSTARVSRPGLMLNSSQGRLAQASHVGALLFSSVVSVSVILLFLYDCSAPDISAELLCNATNYVLTRSCSRPYR